ncbi:MAG: small multi-drug export protein [Candidatus Omnitrophica bacterium]|nr:small multi-drug export protein [Candidatus Omnitrophota bacterium]
MIERIINLFLTSSPKEIIVMILGAMPISELRGAIPFGIASGLPLKKVLFFAIIGNMIPAIPLLFLFEPVSNYLRKFPAFVKFFDWLNRRTMKKASVIEKYEALGLAIFVGIPLPMTGMWTGCFAASLFKIRFRYALLAVITGVLMAALIVTPITLFGKGFIHNVFMGR